MKIFIRNIWGLWSNYFQRDRLRKYLNSLGFYVLTNDAKDILEVYAIKTKSFWEKWL